LREQLWNLNRVITFLLCDCCKQTNGNFNRSQLSKVIYKARCWNCNDFYIGKTKWRLYDWKTERFKALLKQDHSSGTDHVKTTGHNTKWDHLDILASGKIDYHCKVKETLFILDLQPALNANVSGEKLLLQFTESLKHLKVLLQIFFCLGSRPPLIQYM